MWKKYFRGYVVIFRLFTQLQRFFDDVFFNARWLFLVVKLINQFMNDQAF